MNKIKLMSIMKKKPKAENLQSWSKTVERYAPDMYDLLYGIDDKLSICLFFILPIFIGSLPLIPYLTLRTYHETMHPCLPAKYSIYTLRPLCIPRIPPLHRQAYQKQQRPWFGNSIALFLLPSAALPADCHPWRIKAEPASSGWKDWRRELVD